MRERERKRLRAMFVAMVTLMNSLSHRCARALTGLVVSFTACEQVLHAHLMFCCSLCCDVHLNPKSVVLVDLDLLARCSVSCTLTCAVQYPDSIVFP